MNSLAPRILGLVARLAGREVEVLASAPPLDRTAMEGAYHQALTRWFELTALGPAADLAEIKRVHQEILRLIDDVGEPRATTLRRQWARQWWHETGVCPSCGERGPYHDPNGEKARSERRT